jgi:hypothetical protein
MINKFEKQIGDSKIKVNIHIEINKIGYKIKMIL